MDLKRFLLLASLIICEFHWSDSNVLQAHSFMKNYAWSQEQNGSNNVAHSTSRIMENNEQGSKEIITKTVTKPGEDGKLYTYITTTTIQRDFDGNEISKNVTNKIQPASQRSDTQSPGEENSIDLQFKTECSNDEDCSNDKYCSFEKRCKERLNLEESCFRSRQCIHGAKCIWGECRKADLTGKTGSFCEKDADCQQGHCCVAYEDAGKCAYLSREGEACRRDNDFSSNWFEGLPSRCPCESELACENNWDSWTFENTCRGKANKKSKRPHD